MPGYFINLNEIFILEIGSNKWNICNVMRDYFGMWYGCLGSMGSGVGAWEIDYVNLITQAQLFHTMLLKVRGVVKYYIRASRYRDAVRPYPTCVNLYEQNGICDWLIRVHDKYNKCKKKFNST